MVIHCIFGDDVIEEKNIRTNKRRNSTRVKTLRKFIKLFAAHLAIFY